MSIIYVIVMTGFLCAHVSAEGGTVLTNEELKHDDFMDGSALKCMEIIEKEVDVFEVLPGIGWDNIQNTELSQVLANTYHQCKLSEDGRYLIPDSVLLLPVKQSRVDVFAEWIGRMHEYKSVDCFSVNSGSSASVGVAGLGVSGSFSAGYKSAKSHMSRTTSNSYVSRVQARYNRYRIISDPDADFHPSFKSRLLKIAEKYYRNDNHMGDYECQLLIRDFGTHVLTSVDAGAVLFKEDHVDTKTSIVDDVKKKQWQIGAGRSFNLMFDGVTIGGGMDFGISKSKMEETINEYNSNVSFSVVKAYGGIYFGSNTTGAEWTKSLDNELVAIDRTGVPVYELISSSTLPELPLATLLKVGQGVKNAFISYYKHNTYRGCMDPTNKHYDIKANVVDNSVCGGIKNDNEYFGGVYQTCAMSQTDAGDLCESRHYIQKNPLTKDFSCPKGYVAVELISVNISFSQYSMHRSKHWPHTHHGWTDYSFGWYTAFWCASDHSNTPEQKYYFGGVYSSIKPNAVTGAESCPEGFFPLNIVEDVSVCVSSEDTVTGMKFGGFLSCSAGNPLALWLNTNGTKPEVKTPSSYYPKRCPTGYAQQTVSITSNCEIDYCSDKVTNENGQELPVLKRPPFIHRPKEPPANYSDIAIVVDGKWYKNMQAFEKMAEMQDMESKIKEYKKAQESMKRTASAIDDLYNDRHTDSDNADTYSDIGKSVDAFPSYAIAIISSVATLVCVVIATLAFMKCRRKNQERDLSTLLGDNQGELDQVNTDQTPNYGTTPVQRNDVNEVI